MVISVADFTDRFIRIFGNKVWEDFCKYSRSKKNRKCFNSMKDVSAHLIKYNNRCKDLTNFYSHKQYTRFILICIELASGDSKVEKDFDKRTPLLNGNYNRKWEIEHIFPQNSFDDTFQTLKSRPDPILECLNKYSSRQLIRRIRWPRTLSNRQSNTCMSLQFYWTCLYCNIDRYLNKHCLNNLTLISRKLNGDTEYKTADFQTKITLMNSSKENYKEKDFYINRIFKNQSAKLAKDYFRLLLERQYILQFDFDKIFKPDEIGIPIIFFKDILGYSESAVKSTFHITPLKRIWSRKRRRIK